MNTKDKLMEKIEDLNKWAQEELTPYFQGEFGTMDSMLEMFIIQLDEKLTALLTSEVERVLEGVKKKVIGNYIKNYQEWRDEIEVQYEVGRKTKQSVVLVPYYTWLDEKQRKALLDIKEEGK